MILCHEPLPEHKRGGGFFKCHCFPAVQGSGEVHTVPPPLSVSHCPSYPLRAALLLLLPLTPPSLSPGRQAHLTPGPLHVLVPLPGALHPRNPWPLPFFRFFFFLLKCHLSHEVFLPHDLSLCFAFFFSFALNTNGTHCICY